MSETYGFQKIHEFQEGKIGQKSLTSPPKYFLAKGQGSEVRPQVWTLLKSFDICIPQSNSAAEFDGAVILHW